MSKKNKPKKIKLQKQTVERPDKTLTTKSAIKAGSKWENWAVWG